MAQSSILFEGNVSTERFSQMMGDIARNGVVAGEGQQLVVTATGSVMQVNVGTGAAFIGHNRGTVAQRRHYISDATETLGIDAADPTNPRIDRVIIRLNVNETSAANKCKLAILKGTPAASPAIPPLTRSGAVYEISLAQVRVNAGVTAIGNSNITDEREDRFACGYANRTSQLLIHNDRHVTHRALWIQGVDSQTGAFVFITNGDGSLLLRISPQGQVQYSTIVPETGKARTEALSGYDGTNNRLGGRVQFAVKRTAVPVVTISNVRVFTEGSTNNESASWNVTISGDTDGFYWTATKGGALARARFIDFDWAIA